MSRRDAVKSLRSALEDVACRAAITVGGRYISAEELGSQVLHYSPTVDAEFSPCGTRISRSLGDDMVIFPSRTDVASVTCSVCIRLINEGAL